MPTMSSISFFILLTFFLFSFQSVTTRSQRGEKEKVHSEDQASDADADTSLMDRTKKQVRAARDHHQKKSKSLLSAQDELLDLEQLLAETQEKAEATKAVKARSAAIRRQLDDLRQSEQDVQGAESDSDPDDQPVTKAQIANLFSSSLNSAVSSLFFKRTSHPRRSVLRRRDERQK